MFKDKDLVLEDLLTSTLQQLDLQQQRAILRAKGLNVLPVSRLSAQEFHDALAIRYRKLGIPLHCALILISVIPSLAEKGVCDSTTK